MAVVAQPSSSARPVAMCSHPHCMRKATCRQRGAARRYLCGWHGRVKNMGPVERLASAPAPQSMLVVKLDNDALRDRLEQWCADRGLTVREVADYILRKALDKAEAA